MIDSAGLEQAARLVAGRGQRLPGAAILNLRSNVLDWVEEATAEVGREAQMSALPSAELVIADRAGWISTNVKTMSHLLGDIDLKAAESRILAWEGGAFIGVMARAVLGQYDPFSDQLLVVYPNLGTMSDEEGMRWLLFHEVTHVAQFRTAPWIADEIVSAAHEVLSMDRTNFARDLIRQLPDKLPELITWVRDALEGKATSTPLFELLPDDQRQAIERANALVTLLEGHATHITDLIAKRVLPKAAEIDQRVAQRRKRPPLVRLLESVAGLDMKRQQYILGHRFCRDIWEHGGAEALAPAWRGPEWVPTLAELREPQRWLDRVGLPQPA